MQRILLASLLLFAQQLAAYDLLVGAGIGSRSIEINNSENSMQMATFQTQGVDFYPSIGIRSAPQYIWSRSNWAYTISADFFTSKFTKQVISETDSEPEQLKDKGTKMVGISLYAIPLVYYQFNRYAKQRWKYRAGLGIGIGYQNHKGDFLSTNPYQDSFGKIKKIDHSGFGLSTGLYLEASYQKHFFTLSADVVSARPSGLSYEYEESNVSLSYRYQIYSFFLDF